HNRQRLIEQPNTEGHEYYSKQVFTLTKEGNNHLSRQNPIPEYEDECRDIHRLDLEIATRDYRPHGLAEKAKAGFHLFARPQDHSKLRRVLDTHEITAEIFSLLTSHACTPSLWARSLTPRTRIVS